MVVIFTFIDGKAYRLTCQCKECFDKFIDKYGNVIEEIGVDGNIPGYGVH